VLEGIEAALKKRGYGSYALAEAVGKRVRD
jgi:hypothetical protein